jgi:hypothetical protein
MAIKEYYHDIDGKKVNILKDWRLNPLSTIERTSLGNALDTAHSGLVVFDITLGRLFAWDGAQWVSPEAPSGGTTNSYVHDQAIPAATWNIQHNLGYFPNVTVVDSSERVVFGDVTYIDNNNITVDFAGGFSGKAYVS